MSEAHIAAQAAKKRKLAFQEEEEEMSQYTKNELDQDYEFKIVRSMTERFKNPEAIERVKEEEALSGWVLVEVFDSKRLRFKRLRSAQRNDAMLPRGINPYRTQIGFSESSVGVSILVAALILGSLFALLLISKG